MNILYYFCNDGTPMWTWQEKHIFDELKHHNVMIEVINPSHYANTEEANRKCISLLESGKYDLFMTVHGERDLFPDTVISIKRMGIPRVLINFDNKMDPRRHISFSKYFDVLMLLNIEDNPIYKKYQCPYVFAPYAANPYYFKDLRSNNRQQGICFIGTPYGTRCKPINSITSAGIQFDLYANKKNVVMQKQIAAGMNYIDKAKALKRLISSRTGLKVLESAMICKFISQEHLNTESPYLNISPGVDHALMNELYSSYDLSISMPEARNTGVLKKPVDIIHLRNFEIPMCAGLQISRYFDELADFFEEDKEILFYRSTEELIDKVRFYTDSSHSNLVDKMKSAARSRAENEHTWYLRFKKVFETIDVKI